MITLFTVPKPFKGQYSVLQENAIRSWVLLRPKCEIILFGDEAGIEEIAKRYNLIHVPALKRNQFGTPVIDGVFREAQRIARNSLVCCLQADNILMSDFIRTVKKNKKKKFLIFGKRWELDIYKPIDFEDTQWEVRLRSLAKEERNINQYAMDYFVFPRGLCKEIPPFAIGRAGWDNWFIYKFRSQGIPVIDATEAIVLVHQNHDYLHHQDGRTGVYKGEEAKINIGLAGGAEHMFSPYDATWIFNENKLYPAISKDHLKRRIETSSVLYQNKKIKAFTVKTICKITIFLYRNIARFTPKRIFLGVLRGIKR